MHCKYLPVVPYNALEKFSKALYGTTGGTYSARVFRPVMRKLKLSKFDFFCYFLLWGYFVHYEQIVWKNSDIIRMKIPSINSIVTKIPNTPRFYLFVKD